MRLFLGLDLPDDIKKQIQNYLNPIKKSEKGWESSHDYHQTLLFIGEASEEEAEMIKTRMRDISFPAFTIFPTTFQFFNRRVMYLGLEKTAELENLKKAIDQCFPEWSGRETKAFLPHITVKRWQRYEHADLVEGLSREAWRSVSFKTESLSLFKSEKDALNHKYHVIYQVPLQIQSNL
jgi:2'-5' RNA ligase